MQGNFVHIPKGPASTDDISIELYSEHKLNSDVKISLGSHLTSSLPQPKGNRILIIGGNAGTTTQLLIPFSQRIDVVVEKEYIPILQALYKNQQSVVYTFYREGLIGEEHMIPKVDTFNCQINIIEIGRFHDTVKTHNNYNVVLLQNVIVHPQINIMRELMRINHKILITMIVPGKLVYEGLFQLLSGIEANILHLFYNQQKHERLEFVRHLTGRRHQINFWEIFIWKKKNQIDPQEQLKQIAHILEEEVVKNKIGEKKGSNLKGEQIYQSHASVEQYLDFHYGEEEYFGVRNYPLVCAEKVIETSKANQLKNRALDLGCSVGRSTVELAKHFDEVIGLQYSQAFTNKANQILKENYPDLTNKVKFIQGDACKLNKELGKFDAIFGGNLLDRLYDPEAFLKGVVDFMSEKSILVLSSPYTWLTDYTKQEKWIGGYIKDGQPVSTYDHLKQIMQGLGLKQERANEDITFVIKQNHWVYQFTSANFTYWIKQ